MPDADGVRITLRSSVVEPRKREKSLVTPVQYTKFGNDMIIHCVFGTRLSRLFEPAVPNFRFPFLLCVCVGRESNFINSVNELMKPQAATQFQWLQNVAVGWSLAALHICCGIISP